MNRIDRKFRELKAKGEKALITYVMAGDPDPGTTARLVEAMTQAGADIIELGVPFSEPVADGPVIQQAAERALAGGVTIRGILAAVRDLRSHIATPIVLMSYYNPLYQYGLDRLAEDAREAGVDGLIVPDLPLEEAAPLLAATEQNGLALIPLAAPTSTEERLRRIGLTARGFLYCVAVTGVTGAAQKPEEVRTIVARARKCCSLPIAVGFGVSTPERAAEVGKLVDGVVVGTALVREIALDGPQLVERIANITRALKTAVNVNRHANI